MKIHEKPWKFRQLLGKIKKIRAHLSENMLKSGYFITILHKNLGKHNCPPPPPENISPVLLWKLSLFKDCPLYNKQKNTWVLGITRFISCVQHDISLVHCAHSWDIMFNTLYLLTTLNISIQTMDCNNLQNSYVLRILCFGGEGDWLGAGGGVQNISSPLRGVLNIFRCFWGCAKFYGRILEYPPPPSTHTLWPVPKISSF
jgi:hypothetical protein